MLWEDRAWILWSIIRQTIRVYLAEQAGFETTEAEIERVAQLGPWKCERLRVAGFARLLNRWTTRIAESKQASTFVECFAGSIVNRLAKQLVLVVRTHEH